MFVFAFSGAGKKHLFWFFTFTRQLKTHILMYLLHCFCKLARHVGILLCLDRLDELFMFGWGWRTLIAQLDPCWLAAGSTCHVLEQVSRAVQIEPRWIFCCKGSDGSDGSDKTVCNFLSTVWRVRVCLWKIQTECNLEVEPVTQLKSEAQRNFNLFGI